ncbi:MAG: helix-turn-helix domain-containing protein [Clostridia bacterium]|nr:helix-turn-helix domain-containing protein [Clostridia bacterium]MBO4884524.1 helix-turn-helix domain-containing protein [Clostridia bacterium]
MIAIAKNLRIRAARAALGMSQKALAEAVGVSRQTMNAIEQGDYNPTIRLCQAICRVLGKSLDELFWEDDAMKEPCFLVEKDAVWAGMLADVLKQEGIPFLQQGAMGAGMAARTGFMTERYRFFVAGEHLPKAMEIVEELFGNKDE